MLLSGAWILWAGLHRWLLKSYTASIGGTILPICIVLLCVSWKSIRLWKESLMFLQVSQYSAPFNIDEISVCIYISIKLVWSQSPWLMRIGIYVQRKKIYVLTYVPYCEQFNNKRSHVNFNSEWCWEINKTREDHLSLKELPSKKCRTTYWLT